MPAEPHRLSSFAPEIPPHRDDPIAARLLPLLYRRMRAGDDAAVRTRRGELEGLIRSLSPHEARELLDRLHPGSGADQPAGDLARHFRRRLATPTKRALRALLTEKAEASPERRELPRGDLSAERLAGPAQRAASPDLDTRRQQRPVERRTEPIASEEAADEVRDAKPFAGMTQLSRTFKTPKRKVYAGRVYSVYLVIKGKAEVALAAGTGGPSVGVGVKGTESLELDDVSAELAMGELLGIVDRRLDTKLKVKASGEGSFFAELTTGPDRLRLSLSGNPKSPVSIASKIWELEEEHDLETLGARVKAKMQLEVNLDVEPNYANLAREAARRPAAWAALARVRAAGAAAIYRGRAALLSAARFAGQPVALIATAGVAASASRRAMLRRILVRGLRVGGPLLWILEGAAAPLRVLAWLERARRAGLEEGFMNFFRSGYAEELALWTHHGWRGRATALRTSRWTSQPPRVERALAQWVTSPAAMSSEVVMVDLAELDWPATLEAALRVWMAASNPSILDTKSKRGVNVWYVIRDRVAAEARAAGRAAAVQDVLLYIAAMTDAYLVDDQRTGRLTWRDASYRLEEEDGRDGWEQVAEYHRQHFGNDWRRRRETYRSRIVEPTAIAIEPFSGF
jgi:hypothetical protein